MSLWLDGFVNPTSGNYENGKRDLHMHSTFLILTSELKTLPPGLVRQREESANHKSFFIFQEFCSSAILENNKKKPHSAFCKKSGENFIGKLGSIHIKILVCHTIHHSSPSIVSCKKTAIPLGHKNLSKTRREYFKHVIKSNNIYCTPCPPKLN